MNRRAGRFTLCRPSTHTGNALRIDRPATLARHAILLATVLVAASPPVLAQNPNDRNAYRQFALAHAGDPAAGEILFRNHDQLLCTDCHRITGVEKAGPNLDGVADKFTRTELIQHILEPSASIKPGYEQVAVTTKSGRVLAGRLVRTTKQMIRVLDAKGKSSDLLRTDIDELRNMPASLMPDNLLANASKQQFADLIAYLESLHYTVGSGLSGPGVAVDIPKLARPIQFVPLHDADNRFANPVWCGAIPGLPGQLVVIEHQEAKIWRLVRTSRGVTKELFLDLSQDVQYGNNWGLMCIAFHPQFATNQRYFLEHEVAEEGKVKTTIVERRATADLRRDAGIASRRFIAVEQPAFNHNGGCIAFGPDGMLYAAFGDGGPQRDPNGYCQDPRILHGSMIRIDVDHPEADRPYSIPLDNPFLAAHQRDPLVRPETWAIGFREPWRFSFDNLTGELWLGDVGQDKFEEVCIVRRGENHGWNVLEAYEPFSDEYRREDATFTPPLFAYHHALGASITGGLVYRGSRTPSFHGVYIFADYETRRVWGLRRSNGQLAAVRELCQSPEHIASFGADDSGEIYAVGYEGTVFRLDLSKTKFE